MRRVEKVGNFEEKTNDLYLSPRRKVFEYVCIMISTLFWHCKSHIKNPILAKVHYFLNKMFIPVIGGVGVSRLALAKTLRSPNWVSIIPPERSLVTSLTSSASSSEELSSAPSTTEKKILKVKENNDKSRIMRLPRQHGWQSLKNTLLLWRLFSENQLGI